MKNAQQSFLKQASQAAALTIVLALVVITIVVSMILFNDFKNTIVVHKEAQQTRINNLLK